MVHDESNKLMVEIEEHYVHQIAQEHRRNTQNLREQDMPKFDDSDEETDNRDTIMVGKNADSKLFENVEEMIKMNEGAADELEFEEAKQTLDHLLNLPSHEINPRMSRR